MRPLHRLAAGVRGLFRRRQDERDLDEELRGYLDAAIEDHLRAGLTHEEATRAARAQMGSLAAIKDQTRDAGWETVIETAWRDLRYAGRTLRKAPAFSAVAVVTLALAIGANTAIFSVMNAVMLRSLPVERPDELISLTAVYTRSTDPAFSYAAYRQFAAEGDHLVDAIAASVVDRVAITIDGGPESARHKRVSGNYFTMLGVGPALGRTLLPSDDRLPPAAPVAVISDGYWAARFGRDPSVIGRTVRFNAMAVTIVGVAPRGFFGEGAGEMPDIWTPLTAQPSPPWVWNGHSTTWLRILGRRRPGVTLQQAQAGLEPVYARIREDIAAGMERPEFRRGILDSRLAVLEAHGGSRRLRDNFQRPLQVLMGIVGLVLVIACANVASLVLARAAGRRRETAVCLAIGAGRLRLVRQLLAEALLLAGLGATAGLVLALWGTSALAALASRSALAISIDLGPDARVLAFTTLVALATAVVFGLLPALRSARIDPLSALRAAGSSVRGMVRVPLGRTLVVTQIAMSLVLLVGAALFVRSLVQLRNVDTGFDADRVLLLQLTPLVDEQRVTAADRRALYRGLLERAEGVPGVRAASLSFTGLFNNGTWGNVITVEGLTPASGAAPRTFANAIAPRYFEVVGLELVRGRAFTERDHETAPPVAIVNQTFARNFLGGGDPVGRHVGLGAPARVMMEIVGVVADAKYVDLREEDRPMLYVPFTQYDQNLRSLEVRTAGAPAAVAAALRDQLSTVDRRITIAATTTLDAQIDASFAAERLIARLSAAFGLLALALAAVGLYGLTAYVTAQRTGEIGIRIALGGERRDVRWLVMRDLLVLVAIGAAIGLPIALGGARLLESQLYQVDPGDPLAVALGILTLSIAALAAGYLPARRAVRVDPLAALRCE